MPFYETALQSGTLDQINEINEINETKNVI